MKKIVASLFVASMVLSGVSFAQEAEAPEVNRSLSFYLDSFSGQLNKDTGQDVFTGNEFEFGMVYSQNFATVPWLSMWVKALVATGTTPAHDEQGVFLGNTGYSIHGYAMPRAQVGINLGGYSVFAMDTRGLLANENYYTLNFNNAGSLTLQTILEIWAVPQYLTGIKKTTIVDLFEIRTTYSIAFAPRWRYNTKLGFRLGAGGYEWPDHSTNPVDSSAERFGQSFHIRWENQVVWSVTDSFYMWTQLRYQARQIVYHKQPVRHDVFLQAGLGYALDFSK